MRLTRLRRAWTKGPQVAAAVIVDRLRDAVEDRRLGVSTGGLIPIETLLPAWSDCHDYAPTSFHAFHAFMAHVRVEPHDVFVDFGCGKGRVLMLAAQYPFRRVVGVEVVPRLAAAARRNVARLHERRCADVTVWTGRASCFPVPNDASVLYLFNPFHGEELARVLNRVRRSLELSPRRLTIIYNNPAHLVKQLHAYPWLRPRERFSFEHECVIFDASAFEAGIFEAAL